MTTDARTTSFGETERLSPVDRFGNYLSSRSLKSWLGNPAGKHVADVGCGFDARLVRPILDAAAHVTLADVSLSPDLKARANVTCIEGLLPDSLEAVGDATQDLTMCISVLEHVHDDAGLLRQLRRITKPGGAVVVNVPSWMGKRALEFSAFKLGLSPAEEMEDHKRYYDPRDIWPLLVAAGFTPSKIKLRRHKFGLNTLAVCRVTA